jgi:hypothetical protein
MCNENLELLTTIDYGTIAIRKTHNIDNAIDMIECADGEMYEICKDVNTGQPYARLWR